MILYRSFFFPSLLVAQQYIKTYGVYINNIFIKKHNYIVNIGDKIEINKSIKSLVYLIFLLKKKILNSPSKHLEINYINLNIIVKSFFLYSSQNNRKDRIKTFRRTKLIARNDREKNSFR
jgi:ribosomal protein S4